MIRAVRCKGCRKDLHVSGRQTHGKVVSQGVKCPHCNLPNNVDWPIDAAYEALAEFLPASAKILRRIAEAPRSKLAAVLDRWYQECENISIDYAVMERSRSIVCVPAPNLGWNDVGSWGALYDQLAPNGGTLSQGGPVVEYESANNYVQVEGKTVALIGLNDLVVVETPDALLIVPRAKSQKVGKLVEQLDAEGRTRLL